MTLKDDESSSESVPAIASSSDYGRSDVLEFPISDGSDTFSARFQPWQESGSGVVYVGWEIGERSGAYGIFDEVEDTVRLGPSTYRDDSGEPRFAVHLKDDSLAEEMYHEVWRQYAAVQSPSMSAELKGTPPARPTPISETVGPAPKSAVARGPVYTADLSGYLTDTIGRFQPWLPPNSGAVHIAWETDGQSEPVEAPEQSGDYGVLSKHSVHLGRECFETEGRVPMFYAHFGRDGVHLQGAVQNLYLELPDRAFYSV